MSDEAKRASRAWIWIIVLFVAHVLSIGPAMKAGFFDGDVYWPIMTAARDNLQFRAWLQWYLELWDVYWGSAPNSRANP
jgi:hypothetical protein